MSVMDDPDEDARVRWLRKSIVFIEMFASKGQAPYSGDHWQVKDGKMIVRRWPNETELPILKPKNLNVYALHHIVLHDPAVTLRRCRMDQEIVNHYERALKTRDQFAERCENGEELTAADHEAWQEAKGEVRALERTLRSIASSYAHCPGYREEWGW